MKRFDNFTKPSFDYLEVPTPCYICDENLIIRNLEILNDIQIKTGCKILLALKGFAMHSLFKTIKKYLYGITASSLFEARLGFELMKGETHLYAPAYRDDEFQELMKYCDHIIFNSFNQWNHFKNKIRCIFCEIFD